MTNAHCSMGLICSRWIVCLMSPREVVESWHNSPRCFRRGLNETELLLVNPVDTEPRPGREPQAFDSAGAAVLSIRGMRRTAAFVFLCILSYAYVRPSVSRLPVMDADVSISYTTPSDRSSILNQFGCGLRAREDWEKGWATQLTVALMEDSLRAPGNRVVAVLPMDWRTTCCQVWQQRQWLTEGLVKLRDLVRLCLVCKRKSKTPRVLGKSLTVKLRLMSILGLRYLDICAADMHYRIGHNCTANKKSMNFFCRKASTLRLSMS